MRYNYKVKEQGTDKEETMDAMSLKKLIKKLGVRKINLFKSKNISYDALYFLFGNWLYCVP